MKTIKIKKALELKKAYDEALEAHGRLITMKSHGLFISESRIDEYRDIFRHRRLALLEEVDRIGLPAAIVEAERKASVRRITPDDILDDVLKIIDGLNIPMKYLVGCQAWIDHNAQDFSGAYKGRPESTQVCVEWTSGGCIIKQIRRDTCARGSQRIRLTLTSEAQQKLIERISHGKW